MPGNRHGCAACLEREYRKPAAVMQPVVVDDSHASVNHRESVGQLMCRIPNRMNGIALTGHCPSSTKLLTIWKLVNDVLSLQ